MEYLRNAPWAKPDYKRGADIAFAKKYIVDTLVAAGILPNDNRKWVVEFFDDFFLPDKKKLRVKVKILTTKEERQHVELYPKMDRP